MIIGSISENNKIEKRISITPDIVKKYKNLDFKIHLSKGYGDHLGIRDDKYIESGAEIIEEENKILNNSDVLLQLNLLNDNQVSNLKENQILIEPT